jgi:hypothetical protein
MDKMTLKTEQIQFKIVAPGEIQLFYQLGILRGTRKDDRSFLRVVPRRMFPISLRNQYISLRDAGQNEIGIVKDPQILDDASRTALENELRRQYFVPLITRILDVRDQLGILEWHVETDRGPTVFFTKGFHRNLTETDRGFLISDLDEKRFEIRDFSEMDVRSRMLLQKMG